MCFVPNRKYAPLGSPAFSDSEVITIALFGEMVFSGAEDKTLHFIRQYHLDMFPQLLDSSRFNRRKRRLTETMEAIRCRLRDRWHSKHPLADDIDHLRLVDSAPVPICTYTRGARCQSVPLDWRNEWFGVCASKKGCMRQQKSQVLWCSLPHHHDPGSDGRYLASGPSFL